jgi:hypothetical protein
MHPSTHAHTRTHDFTHWASLTPSSFQSHIQRAIASGKWPLILDSNPGSPFVTFMQVR